MRDIHSYVKNVHFTLGLFVTKQKRSKSVTVLRKHNKLATQ